MAAAILIPIESQSAAAAELPIEPAASLPASPRENESENSDAPRRVNAPINVSSSTVLRAASTLRCKTTGTPNTAAAAAPKPASAQGPATSRGATDKTTIDAVGPRIAAARCQGRSGTNTRPASVTT